VKDFYLLGPSFEKDPPVSPQPPSRYPSPTSPPSPFTHQEMGHKHVKSARREYFDEKVGRVFLFPTPGDLNVANLFYSRFKQIKMFFFRTG